MPQNAQALKISHINREEIVDKKPLFDRNGLKYDDFYPKIWPS